LSLQIGIGATIVATILGTMIVFGLGRYRFRGRGSSNLPGHRWRSQCLSVPMLICSDAYLRSRPTGDPGSGERNRHRHVFDRHPCGCGRTHHCQSSQQVPVV